MNIITIIEKIKFEEFDKFDNKHDFISFINDKQYLLSDLSFLKYCEPKAEFLTYEFWAWAFVLSEIDVYDLVHNFLNIIMDNRFLREIKWLKDEFEFLNKDPEYYKYCSSNWMEEYKKRQEAILRINRFIDEIQCRL